MNRYEEPFTVVVRMEREQCKASISIAATPLAECREAQRFLMGQLTDGGAWVCGYGRTPEDAVQAVLAEFGRAALAYFRHREER